jgi:FemAB-related protein (PEP-CTERM system-associated)
MRVIEIADAVATRKWGEYVAPLTMSVYDLPEWTRILAEAYGIKSHVLAALEDDRIVGTLGLFEIKHAVFGHYLTTAAFDTDGGFHFDSTTARDALAAEARALAARLDVSYLVIRTRGTALDGFYLDQRYRTAIVDLEGGAEVVWYRLPSKTRNQVRRGMKEGFTLAAGLDQRDAFFDVFHRHMRDLGSPAHSRAYYEAIVAHLGDHTEFVTVRDGKVVVSGALVFRTNGTAMNYHTVSLRQYNRRCPNYLLYWRMIEASCGYGDRVFDMGRSEAGSSAMDFKNNWAPREVVLDYNYFLVKAKEVPFLNPRNPKFRLATAVWKQLPLAVTKTLGPHLISGLA